MNEVKFINQDNECGNFATDIEPKTQLKKMAHTERNRKVIMLLLFLFCGYYGWQFGGLLKAGNTASSDTITNILNAIEFALFSKLQPMSLYTIGFAILNILILNIFFTYQKATRKNFRPGEEHGSAKKGDILHDATKLNAAHNKNKDKQSFDNNIILSENIHLDMDTWHTKLNNNVFVVGGSGSGKTRYFVKPNVLQLKSNYVIIDPKGSVAEDVGNAFQKAGYEIRYLNLVDMDKSMCYNPFQYFHCPEDIQNFVRNLIDNTSDKNQTGGDEFFVKSEITWLTAVIFYVMATCEGTDKCNMNTVMLMLDHSKAAEENDDYMSEVDAMFNELEIELNSRNNGRSEFTYADLAVRNYKIFKMGAGKTAKSILISVGVRLSIFNLPSLRRIMSKDELHLDHFGNPMVNNTRFPNDLGKDIDRDTYCLGKSTEEYEALPQNRLRKVVLFVIISDNVKTFSFLSSIILEQMYTQLYEAADRRKDHKLPIHTRFINDEFANCGKQPDFNRKISTMRSREISTAVIVQGISQIKSKSLYGDEWEAIFENCDTTLFLGSKGPTTLQEIQKLAGKETVALKSQSVTKGRNSSVSESTQYLMRDLYDYAELGKMPNDKCLVHIKGYDIFEDKKFDVLNHPNVFLTVDTKDETMKTKNHFDIAEYLKKASDIDSSRVEAIKDEFLKEDIHALETLDSLNCGDIFESSPFECSEEIYLDSDFLDEIQNVIKEEAEIVDLSLSMLPN